MIKYVLFLLVTLGAGVAAGWATNHYRYGYREPEFGPMTIDGKVTAANAVESYRARLPAGLAKAEMVGGAKHDFGVMEPGEEGEHAFVIKNVGDEPLKLRIGATSCKCTLGSLDKESLLPGEQTEVNLSWTIKTESGEFVQTAQLHTNDPAEPVINLSVSGRVVREIDIVPKALSFGEIASGETIQLSANIYSYFDGDIEHTETKFTSEAMTELSTFDVEEYQPTEDEDRAHADARQAFRVNVTIEPGMQQGPVSQKLLFGFRFKDRTDAADDPSDDQDNNSYVVATTTGRIVGPLSMIPNPKLKGKQGGGYVYDFGHLGKDDATTGKAFVVLKGSERESTELTIGKAEPDGVITANLGEPLSKGSMTLYPLELTLVPGDDPVQRLGMNKQDFGMIWIDSNNPKVPRMRIGVKFALPSRKEMATSK